ncbi:MAG: tRNA lysidine(34) synthetase TilS [Oscillospiraceae bacterium]|nr:tRNA lysidine(34) synthetase TilS [Oscillospiraceae bacterium]
MERLSAAERLCEKYNMLPPNVTVLCAVSGGADSVCLLHWLLSRGVTVAAGHYNHRLRGEESERDRRFVERLCGELNVPFYCGEGDVAAYARASGLGTEEAARELRYEFLEATAESIGAERIATAHNAGDNAETVLLNLSRGAGLNGACGIPPVRGRIIRPLLGVTRAQIERYLDENGLEHVEDSTNAADDYARNRLRHRALPALEGVNERAEENIFLSCERLRRDAECLDAMAERFVREKGSGGSLPAAEVAALPRAVAARAVKLMCPKAESVHIDALLALCECSRSGAAADVPEMRVRREGDRLVFRAREYKAPERCYIETDKTTILSTGAEIKCEFLNFCAEVYKSFNTFFVKNENICGRIFVAPCQGGEKVRLSGRGCTKTMKKLRAEAGLTPRLRAEYPVLYDERGIIAAYGFGTAERCAAKSGDRGVVKIDIIMPEGENHVTQE